MNSKDSFSSSIKLWTIFSSSRRPTKKWFSFQAFIYWKSLWCLSFNSDLWRKFSWQWYFTKQSKHWDLLSTIYLHSFSSYIISRYFCICKRFKKSSRILAPPYFYNNFCWKILSNYIIYDDKNLLLLFYILQ